MVGRSKTPGVTIDKALLSKATLSVTETEPKDSKGMGHITMAIEGQGWSREFIGMLLKNLSDKGHLNDVTPDN